jgi:hypothetical protein
VPRLAPQATAGTSAAAHETLEVNSVESVESVEPVESIVGSGPSWSEQLADAVNALAPTPASLPAITMSPFSALGSSGSASSSSLTSGGSSSAIAALLASFALLLLVIWRPLQRQSLSIPTGIVLNSPLPPG